MADNASNASSDTDDEMTVTYMKATESYASYHFRITRTCEIVLVDEIEVIKLQELFPYTYAQMQEVLNYVCASPRFSEIIANNKYLYQENNCDNMWAYYIDPEHADRYIGFFIRDWERYADENYNLRDILYVMFDKNLDSFMLLMKSKIFYDFVRENMTDYNDLSIDDFNGLICGPIKELFEEILDQFKECLDIKSEFDDRMISNYMTKYNDMKNQLECQTNNIIRVRGSQIHDNSANQNNTANVGFIAADAVAAVNDVSTDDDPKKEVKYLAPVDSEIINDKNINILIAKLGAHMRGAKKSIENKDIVAQIVELALNKN